MTHDDRMTDGPHTPAPQTHRLHRPELRAERSTHPLDVSVACCVLAIVSSVTLAVLAVLTVM